MHICASSLTGQQDIYIYFHNLALLLNGIILPTPSPFKNMCKENIGFIRH